MESVAEILPTRQTLAVVPARPLSPCHRGEGWTTEQRDLVRKLIAKGCTDDEMALFTLICQRTGLDPFARQIYALVRGTGEDRKMTIQTSIDGFRLIADRTGQYVGNDPAIFDTEDADQPLWAKVTVYKLVHGEAWGFTALARWREYCPGDKQAFMWKKMPYTMLGKCFSADTEVLTEHGFMRFADITAERILQVSDRGLEPVVAKPFAQSYTGPMVTYDSDDLNFCVTPNHDMVTTYGKVEAGAMYATSNSRGPWLIPRLVHGSGLEAPFTDEQLRLCAYVVADGQDNGHRQYTISVSRPRKIAALTALALHGSHGIRHSRGNVAVTPRREIRSNFDKEQFRYPKELVEPLLLDGKQLDCSLLLMLSARQAKILVNAWIEFDGYCNRKTGVRRVYSSRLDHLQAFEVAAMMAGYALSPRHPRQSDIGGINYALTISEHDEIPVFRRGSEVPSLAMTPYDGLVWCVTVPSGVIVVRRHGFSMLCGNCAEALALRKAFPQQLSGLYTQEEMQQADSIPSTAQSTQALARGSTDQPDNGARQVLLWEISDGIRDIIRPLKHTGLWKAIIFEAFGCSCDVMETQSLAVLQHGLPLFRHLCRTLQRDGKPEGNPHDWIRQTRTQMEQDVSDPALAWELTSEAYDPVVSAALDAELVQTGGAA